jgi:hypothetical protein
LAVATLVASLVGGAALSSREPAAASSVSVSLESLNQTDRAQAELTRLYLAYFGRLPDVPGLTYWLSVRDSGTSLAEISSLFAASTEFQRRYGALDDQQFVDLVYRNVLTRAGEESGVRYWVGELGRGASRGQIMIGFSESVEFVRRTGDRQVTAISRPVGLEALRNRNPLFGRYEDRRGSEIDLWTPGLMTAAERPDNGSVGDGQFRVACEYSHFAYDDPIIHPGQPGASHLHMFFGNTRTNAFSTTDSLVNSGGGSCNGFELNRSGYWTPALLDGRGNVVVPERIILYYKSKRMNEVEAMPQGLKMVVGNMDAESFQVSQFLSWSCGTSGFSRAKSNRIQPCGSGEYLTASISFPQCWDGRLDSPDHRSHMYMVAPEQPCPGSHPRRLPQISILLYFPSSSSVDGWHLSSDQLDGFNGTPGGTLHADWWGGWNDDAMNLWTNGCMRAARNCSFGQTGGSNRLAPLNGLETYQGPNFLPLPPR